MLYGETSVGELEAEAKYIAIKLKIAIYKDTHIRVNYVATCSQLHK